MTQLNAHDARCEALFASGLQRPDAPTAEAVAATIGCTLRHPEAATDRRRWVRQLTDQVFASPVLHQTLPVADRAA
jgi:hypothetical protein